MDNHGLPVDINIVLFGYNYSFEENIWVSFFYQIHHFKNT